MSVPSVLLFDLGGVLIENSGFEDLNRMLSRPLDDETIRERWLASPSVRNFELGKISAAEFAEHFLAEWEIAISASEFLEEFGKWPKGFFPGARELVGSLRKKYRVACLSNSNALHWEKFDGFDVEFDVAMSSHLLGVIKPDHSAFARALELCRADPHEVFFFDDSRANVRAANDFGIKAVHVDGFQSLLRVLDREGLSC